MGTRFLLFCALLGTGCAQAVAPIEMLSQPSQARADAVDADLQDVLRAVLSFYRTNTDTTILVGQGLDARARAALRLVHHRTAARPDMSGPAPLPADAIVIDSVIVSGQRALVRLTLGPISSEIGWVCGRVRSVPLRRVGRWEVVEAELRDTCAGQGPRGLSADQERLVEAARLAFSQIRLGPTVRVASGPGLSADALASLRTIGEVLPGNGFETDAMVVPPDVFVVHKLERSADRVEFAGTLGPVPRNAGLACGESWSLTLRRHTDGWSFEDFRFIVCQARPEKRLQAAASAVSFSQFGQASAERSVGRHEAPA